MPTLPPIPATGDFIQILAVNPPATNGLSPSNTITLTVRYRLAVGTGTLQIWFERFKDANCTTLDSDARGSEKGGSTIPGGLMQTISGGSQEMLVVSSRPSRLWMPATSAWARGCGQRTHPPPLRRICYIPTVTR
jgi:hypothetical protein